MTRSELFAAANKHRVRRQAGRWAVFGCGDPGYVPKLLVALASAKEHNPSLDAFLFCTSCGDGDLVAAGRAGVDIIFCDPSLPFVRPSRPGLPLWPRESFAHLLAWRILSSFGYEFSLSIDADVLCCNPLPLESINMEHVDFAAVSNGSTGHQFRSIDLPDREERRYFSALPGLGRRAANTGIMAWNHRRLKAVRFHKKILSVLRGLPPNYAVPSDQHLLAIAIATYPFQIAWLDTRWNFCFGSETGVGRLKLYQSRWHPDRFVGSLDALFFLHLFKPWERLVNPEPGMASSASENCFREGLVRWIKIARSLYGEEWSKPLLGMSTGLGDAGPLRPCPLAWPACPLRLASRVLAPSSGLSLLLQRELRPVSEFLGYRAPADFSISLLQMAIPALHPERLVLRSESAPGGQVARPRFSRSMMVAGFVPAGISVPESPFLHYFRRFTTRMVRWWEQNRPYPIRKKWSSLPPVRSLVTPGPTLLVLATPPMLDESAWCAWSWARHLGNSFRLVVASDGGLPARFQEIKTILPDAEITQAAAIAQVGDPDHAHLAAFLRAHPLGRKLAAILALQNSQDLLFLDSDVLALAPPVSLLGLIARQKPCFNQESQPAAYDWEIVEAGRQLGLSPCDRLNSGLLYIPRNSLDAGLADRLLGGRSSPTISWFTEQTVLAFLMKAAGAQALPPERYVVSNERMFWWQEDIDYSAVDSRHFTGMTRHLLYMRGYPVLSRSKRT